MGELIDVIAAAVVVPGWDGRTDEACVVRTIAVYM
jgi:hypothetical protein